MDRTFGGSSGQGGKEYDGDVPPVIVAVMGPAGVSRLGPAPFAPSSFAELDTFAPPLGRQVHSRAQSRPSLHQEHPRRRQGSRHRRYWSVATALDRTLSPRADPLLAGKNRRLTIIECPNDLSAMIDVAKVADLVLLMIDGSFGFEMVRRAFD